LRGQADCESLQAAAQFVKVLHMHIQLIAAFELYHKYVVALVV
jgi:hypothetical protein